MNFPSPITMAKLGETRKKNLLVGTKGEIVFFQILEKLRVNLAMGYRALGS